MKREWLIAALVMGLAMMDAGRLAWVCDDAFISYRYAAHWVDGLGLVYNAGEYVEGYTNFLWTILLALGEQCGFPLPEWSIAMGLLAYFLALMGLAWKPTADGPDWYALLAGVSIVHFRIFATSGLETMSMVACLVWALRAFEAERFPLGFSLSFLACLIRPEGAALLAFASLFALRHKAAHRPMIVAIGAAAVYALWKLGYYGDLLPNTYYAKVDEPRWSQGFLYLWASFGAHIGTLFIWIAPLIMWKRLKPVHWLSFSLVCVYTLHVAKVGGDFMLGRFALPIMACGLLCLHPIAQALSIRPWVKRIVWLSLLWIPWQPAEQSLLDAGIGQERDWYPEFWRIEAERQGVVLQSYLKDSDIKMVIYGGQAMLGYYAEAPWILEGMAGLTDSELARMPKRAQRVAHGAKASVAYLQDRQVDIYVNFRIQQPMHPMNWIDFGEGVYGSIISYNADKMAYLKEKGARFIDFPAYLDEYCQSVMSGDIGADQLRSEWPRFEAYYFQHTVDPERRGCFAKFLSDP